MGLRNKSAVVTGAASGIGAGTAEVFTEEGARLVLVDRDEAGLAAGRERGSAEVVAVGGDVADPATARRAVATALEAFGALDVLSNIAGVMSGGDFLSVDEAAWDAVLNPNPNLRGTYPMCRAAVPPCWGAAAAPSSTPRR